MNLETKPLPSYLRISQLIPRSKFPHTYEGVKAAVYDLYEPEYAGKYFLESVTQPSCLWGTGVYKVESDGSLKLIQSDWDTSD